MLKNKSRLVSKVPKRMFRSIPGASFLKRLYASHSSSTNETVEADIEKQIDKGIGDASSSPKFSFIAPPASHKPVRSNVFNLCIHHYDYEGISLPKPEKNFTLLDVNITVLQELQEVLSKFSNLNEMESTVAHILKNLISYRDIMQRLYPAPAKEGTPCLEDFNFDGRGLLLTLLHAIHDTMLCISERKELERVQARLVALRTLVKYLYTIAKEREVLISKKLASSSDPSNSTKTLVHFPFCQSIDLDTYEDIKSFDSTAFFMDIGSQYLPRLRLAYSMLVRATAAYSDASGMSDMVPHTLRQVAFAMNNFYYLVNLPKAASSTKEFHTTGAERVTGLWGLSQMGVARVFNNIFIPHVTFSRLFSITTFNVAALQANLQQLVNGTSNRIEEIPTESAPEAPELMLEKNSQKAESQIRKTIEISEKQEKKGEDPVHSGCVSSYEHFVRCYNDIKNHKLLGKYSQTKLGIRIISNKAPTLSMDYVEHDFLEWGVHLFKRAFSGSNTSTPKTPEQISNTEDSVIIHIHGGGFVSMSSAEHEVYLRRWVNATDIPVFSIEYQLAPDQKYPVQLLECYHGYKWIVENAAKLFGYRKLRKVILCGDSAGGNLALGVMSLALHEGFRKPDVMMLAYPATYLGLSPCSARLCSLIDPLLNYKLLMICSSSYTKGKDLDNPKQNPLVSPSLLPDEILKQFPPTYITCGSLDPLFDDTTYIAKRISSLNGGRVTLDVYDALGHGFLNTAYNQLPATAEAAENMAKWLLNVL